MCLHKKYYIIMLTMLCDMYIFAFTINAINNAIPHKCTARSEHCII